MQVICPGNEQNIEKTVIYKALTHRQKALLQKEGVGQKKISIVLKIFTNKS